MAKNVKLYCVFILWAIYVYACNTGFKVPSDPSRLHTSTAKAL